MLVADGPHGAPRLFKRAWTLVILALTVLPYLINYWRTPHGETYTWMLPPYPADAYAYRAWAKQAFDGRWLFSLKFTALAHRPFLFLPFFLAAGRLARLTGADIGVTLLGLKSIGVVFFFWALFGLLRQLKLTPVQSIAAAALAGISSGLGGFAPLAFPEGLPRAWSPVDVWLVDSNTFWSLLWNPLFPFSLALILLAVRWADESLEENEPRRAWRGRGVPGRARSSSIRAPLAVLYPLFDGPLRRQAPQGAGCRSGCGSSAPRLPARAVHRRACPSDPLLRAHNDLGTEGSHALFSYLSGFGLPLALAAAGPFFVPGFAKKYWPLWAWLAISVALTYCPIWFRIKYVFGAHLPICLLAGAAAEPLLDELPWRRAGKTALAVLVLAAMSCTQFFNFREGLAEVETNDDGMKRIGDGKMAGLRFLEARGDHDALVFAAPPTSAKIAPYSGNTVMWGHWAHGVDAREREEWIANVFSNRSGA